MSRIKYIKYSLIIYFFISPFKGNAGSNQAARAAQVHHITTFYPDQLTNPQKKTRKTMSQFGYNLSYFSIQLFPITSFINPNEFGIHSYSQPGSKEKNGCLYTCRGGFIDFSHLRAAADWTVYLAFTILNDPQDLELPPEAGSLKLNFKNLEHLTTDEIADMAQRIAFERLQWHEVASWYYHPPYHARTDQQSAFTPEDAYSNLLGTSIGKKIALRILNDLETRTYAEIASEEIEKTVKSLQPVAGKKESKQAYDKVDRYKQVKLSGDKRNDDVWWDSNILFRDQRYVFKRDIDFGPEVDPWLVPQAENLGCATGQQAEILTVPTQTLKGISFYEYYTFTIIPDTSMFYGRKGKPVHKPFSDFTTDRYDEVTGIIAAEMEQLLLPGFNKRDCCDPVSDFKNVRRVGIASVVSGRDN